MPTVPSNVTLTAELDTLHIHLPGMVSAPTTPAARNLAAPVLIASPIVLAVAAGLMFKLGGSALLLSRPDILAFGVLLSVVNIGLGVYLFRPQRRSIKRQPSVRVELRTHSLWINSGAMPEEILFERIEKVTVDRAGARMRVAGRTRYLLPGRSDEERAWLAGLLRDVLAARQHTSPAESARARTQLAALLQQASTPPEPRDRSAEVASMLRDRDAGR